MRLMIVRHAKADKAAPGARDRDRPLAARGLKDAPQIGRYMAHHGLLPGQALVSPARRTRETFASLASAWPTTVPVFFDDRLYEASPQDILAAIRETPSTTKALVVVGHNPGLHELAGLLIAAGDVAARERLYEGLPTCALAVIDFAGDAWEAIHLHSGRLERFVTPRLLRTATD